MTIKLLQLRCKYLGTEAVRSNICFTLNFERNYLSAQDDDCVMKTYRNQCTMIAFNHQITSVETFWVDQLSGSMYDQ